MKTLLGYFALPFVISTVHWIVTRLYANYCVPGGFSGYVQALLTTASPVCNLGLALMEKTGSLYTQSWMFLSFWAIGLLMSLYKQITGKESSSNIKSFMSKDKTSIIIPSYFDIDHMIR